MAISAKNKFVSAYSDFSERTKHLQEIKGETKARKGRRTEENCTTATSSARKAEYSMKDILASNIDSLVHYSSKNIPKKGMKTIKKK